MKIINGPRAASILGVTARGGIIRFLKPHGVEPVNSPPEEGRWYRDYDLDQINDLKARLDAEAVARKEAEGQMAPQLALDDTQTANHPETAAEEPKAQDDAAAARATIRSQLDGLAGELSAINSEIADLRSAFERDTAERGAQFKMLEQFLRYIASRHEPPRVAS